MIAIQSSFIGKRILSSPYHSQNISHKIKTVTRDLSRINVNVQRRTNSDDGD